MAKFPKPQRMTEVELSAELAHALDAVQQREEAIVIIRDGRPAAVLVNVETLLDLLDVAGLTADDSPAALRRMVAEAEANRGDETIPHDDVARGR